MVAYFGDYDEEMSGMEEGEEFTPMDPFEGLSKRDQDIFFRLLDIVPREYLEAAMEYFMDHPQKIRSVIAYAKERKEAMAKGNTEELNTILEQEGITIESLKAQAALSDADYGEEGGEMLKS